MISSRIARKPIEIPQGVTVNRTGSLLEVKGPKGVLTCQLNQTVDIELKDSILAVKNVSESAGFTNASERKTKRSILGTTRANIANMVIGVTQGFEKKLTTVGVGYRAQAKGKILGLSLGHSHPDDFNVPEGITIETPSQTEIIIKGIDIKKVSDVAADIRSIRPPEPYKGKGVRYADENVERKEAKK